MSKDIPSIAPSDSFTELAACRLYQTLVNTLDPEPFIARLAPDVRYTSQWVCNDLNDAGSVADLLRAKVAAARERGGADHEAVLCVSTAQDEGMPVIALVARATQKPAGTVSFRVDDGHIAAVYICVLPVYAPVRLDDPDHYHWPRDRT